MAELQQAKLQQAILQMAALLQKLAQPTPAPSNPEQTLEALATNICEFSFDPENGITFEKWYSRYADLFDSDARNLEDAAKVRLLLRKLDTPSHTRYTNYILPKLPKDIVFTDTVETLKKIFGSQTSVFSKRYHCLQLEKSESEDIISYGGKVNRACEDFDFKNVKIDQFKCLVFVCGLKSHCYADIRARLLSRIEAETAEAPVTLQHLIDDYQRLVNLKADTSMIERQSSSNSSVHAVQEKKGFSRQQQFSKPEGKLPRTPCWQCGQMHYVRDCPFTHHHCRQCNRTGHKEGYCGCFSKPKSVPAREEKKSLPKKSNKSWKAKSRGVYIVNHIAQQCSKRKYVPTLINGVATKLQLDTASDITVISKQTWKYLGKPTIKHSTIEAMNASGKPLHLLGEFRCDVSINGKTAQGRCFVTTAANLNLLGIDWIELFELWSVPIDSICNQVKTKSVDQQIRELRAKHADVFNNSLGHCKKTKVSQTSKSHRGAVNKISKDKQKLNQILVTRNPSVTSAQLNAVVPLVTIRRVPSNKSVLSDLQPAGTRISSRSSSNKKQNEAFNKKHGAVQRSFKHGDSVYAKVHRTNSWQWEPATVIEKIGSVNYNVFLEDQHRLIRSHANQLKLRAPSSPASTADQPTPLSIFLDGFGLALTVPANVQSRQHPTEQQVQDDHLTDEPGDDDDPEDGTEPEDDDEPEDGDDPTPTEIEEPIQPVTPILERGRRMIQLPARFKPYWMLKP